jgi:hypothetical protein
VRAPFERVVVGTSTMGMRSVHFSKKRV